MQLKAGGARAGAGLLFGEVDVPEKNNRSTRRGILWSGEMRAAKNSQSGKARAAWRRMDFGRPMPAIARMHDEESAFERGVVAGGCGLRRWSGNTCSRRGGPEFSAQCPKNQARDGNCYAPGVGTGCELICGFEYGESRPIHPSLPLSCRALNSNKGTRAAGYVCIRTSHQRVERVSRGRAPQGSDAATPIRSRYMR